MIDQVVAEGKATALAGATRLDAVMDRVVRFGKKRLGGSAEQPGD